MHVVSTNSSRRNVDADPMRSNRGAEGVEKRYSKEIVNRTNAPLVFDRSSGWNGTSHEEGVSFCEKKANSRSICPWRAYCPRGHLFSGFQSSENESELWAPIASQGQPVWVNVGSFYPCMQRGQLDESSKSKIRYIMCCHEGEEGNIDSLVDLATVNQTELLIENGKCMKRCQELNDAENSIIPSPPKPHCLARCRWMNRQKAVSRLTNFSAARRYVNGMTTSPPLMEGRCMDITDGLRHDGVCTSVGHRQKPKINLVLSSNGWLGNEFDLGLRDCAASRCYVSSGPGHTNSSHMYAGTVQRVAHPAHVQKATAAQINIMVQPESLKNTNGGKPMRPEANVDWLASHRRDEFAHNSWIPYSYVNADDHHFRIRGKSHEERRTSIPVFIRNCDPASVHSDRARRITELGRHVEIEQFGRCDLAGTRRTKLEDAYPECTSLPRRSAMWDAQKECVFFHSMFALVVENTFEENYLTEKIYQPLKMGTVPIVMGNSSIYWRHLPDPLSAVFLDDFDSYETAARYLHTLANNSTSWEKHRAWKENALSEGFSTLASNSFATLPCDLCDKYAEEILPVSERGWDRTLGLETLDSCVADLLSSHTMPYNLPLVNPVFGFDAVFVIHYTPLADRKKVMMERIRQVIGVNPIFIEDFDREALADEDVECFGDSKAQMAYIQRVAKKGEVSLTMKHFTAYFYMVQQSLDNVLVLEDDAAFAQSDWTSKESVWQKILRDLPESYDLLLLSAFGNNRRRGEKITDHIYLAQQSRVASMYLISQKGARNMLRSLPMVSIIDFQMNYAANHTGNKWMTKLPGFHGPRTIDIEIYHSEPPLSHQVEPDGLKSTWLN